MIEKKVGLHFGPKDDPAKHDKLLQRSYTGIITNVENAGHEVVVTRGADHFDFSRGNIDELWVPRLDDGTLTTTRVLGDVALHDFGVVRDFGRLLRPTAEHPLHLLNDPSLGEYDNSKLKANREILFDRQVPTVPVGNTIDAFDLLEGGTIVVKPDKGAGGRGVEILDRSELASVINREADVQLIAQEYLDMTHPFPSEIHGLDEADRAAFASLKDRKKELRMFVFRGKDALETIPVARFMKQGDETSDTWVHVDPDTVPHELVQSSAIVADRLAATTGIDEVYAAIDHVWGSTESEPELQWRVGEFNLWRPAFHRKGDLSVARRYDAAMAEQLVRIARTPLKTGTKE